MKNVLSIAGSDCSAGAGIQADLKTFVANGVYGMTVITSLTAQNPQKVKMLEDVSIEMLKNQIEAIFDVMEVSAVKIGMLNSKENGETIYDELLKYKARNIVLDPVMIATSGNSLIREETKRFLVNELFKIADIITPNLDETKENFVYARHISVKNSQVMCYAEFIRKIISEKLFYFAMNNPKRYSKKMIDEFNEKYNYYFIEYLIKYRSTLSPYSLSKLSTISNPNFS